ncbi:DapH/DapD/GlmU-related protein [Flavobacterium sp. HTF]|uniref:DapH/DapD/GlmU-related protein n=1 Tax=Flavobacterium sp. HTF TaxID=2170732 RepID=UPI000D5CE0BA|nr:DapH/DapD/GlmU-related protein [Flavobacterium sp. HTF]PWB27218.1 LpxA family transferase [Flavobacterium sp. HTF]
MITIKKFVENINYYFPDHSHNSPWELVEQLGGILLKVIAGLSYEYHIEGNIAIHKKAVVEKNVSFKGIIIISENCFVGANSYLRGPILLGKNVTIGPGAEIKQSFISDNSIVAHFNYIGNSIIGQNINFEAGSICANHYNERENKQISVKYKDVVYLTNSEKFGSLIGDHSKIGANAVLSPGTILVKNTIVKRLELIQQLKE